MPLKAFHKINHSYLSAIVPYDNILLKSSRLFDSYWTLSPLISTSLEKIDKFFSLNFSMETKKV